MGVASSLWVERLAFRAHATKGPAGADPFTAEHQAVLAVATSSRWRCSKPLTTRKVEVPVPAAGDAEPLAAVKHDADQVVGSGVEIGRSDSQQPAGEAGGVVGRAVQREAGDPVDEHGQTQGAVRVAPHRDPLFVVEHDAGQAFRHSSELDMAEPPLFV